MASKIEIDPADSLIVDDVGPWASEKHDRLRRYIDASRAARRKFLPPANPGGASYIDLYSGPGRSWIRDTSNIVDGSPLVAIKAAIASNARFSELHFGDLNELNRRALEKRVHSLGYAPMIYAGAAEAVVDEVIYALNPAGLHFAFLDPYNLDQLPFSIIEKLCGVKRMDLLIHVSLQDLQRNLDAHTVAGGVLDRFMPGWRAVVDPRQSIAPLRAALLAYWLDLIRSQGKTPARGELVVGSKSQRLYWLVFVSGSELAQRLWDDIRDVRGQAQMEF